MASFVTIFTHPMYLAHALCENVHSDQYLHVKKMVPNFPWQFSSYRVRFGDYFFFQISSNLCHKKLGERHLIIRIWNEMRWTQFQIGRLKATLYRWFQQPNWLASLFHQAKDGTWEKWDTWEMPRKLFNLCAAQVDDTKIIIVGEWEWSSIFNTRSIRKIKRFLFGQILFSSLLLGIAIGV